MEELSLGLPKGVQGLLSGRFIEWTFNSPFFTIVEPPLTATSRLQRPRFFLFFLLSQDGQKNPYIDSCLNPLYNDYLFPTATFFCPEVLL